MAKLTWLSFINRAFGQTLAEVMINPQKDISGFANYVKRYRKSAFQAVGKLMKKKDPKNITDLTRSLLVALKRAWPKWMDALKIVKPETVALEMFRNSIVLKIGSLDDPSVIKSTMNVWVSSAR